MFVVNPLTQVQGLLSLSREPLAATAVPPNEVASVTGVLRALQLITALRNLQETSDGQLLQREAGKTLIEAIVEMLREAARLTNSAPFGTLLEARAAGFLSADTRDAACLHAGTSALPVHVVAGRIPSWRFPRHPALFTGIVSIALPYFVPSTREIDSVAEPFFADLVAEIGLSQDFKREPLPQYDVCDLLACAGDALGQPMHIATFLPDDEGMRSSQVRRSLVYRNLYASRHSIISRPLAAQIAHSRLKPEVADARFTEQLLIVWLRGHDWGHTVFDPLCKGVSTLPRYERYALQEALADLSGLRFVIEAGAPLLGEADAARFSRLVFDTYFSELLRYARRAANESPDALAAWMQLSHFKTGGALSIASDGRVDGDYMDILMSTRQAFLRWLGLARSKNAGALQAVVDASASAAEPYRNLADALRTALNTRAIPFDLDPIFLTADDLIADSSTTSATRSQGVVQAPSCVHRF